MMVYIDNLIWHLLFSHHISSDNLRPEEAMVHHVEPTEKSMEHKLFYVREL